MNGKNRDIQPVHLAAKIMRRFIWTLLGRRPDFTERDEPGKSDILGRSVAIRVVDGGSSGETEQEILAIFNPVYDAERHGFHLVVSPRHADVLLVCGPLTRNMEAALLAAFAAMPEPRRVVTIGDEIAGQGIFRDSYAVVPLPEEILAARVAHVPGDPPSPGDILTGLCTIDWGT